MTSEIAPSVRKAHFAVLEDAEGKLSKFQFIPFYHNDVSMCSKKVEVTEASNITDGAAEISLCHKQIELAA